MKTSWSGSPLSHLTRHLIAQHHHFVRDELARIASRLMDLCTPRSPATNDLLALRVEFARLSETVLAHLHREEATVFPFIEALESALASAALLDPGRGELAAEVCRLTAQHDTIAAQLRALSEVRLRLAADGGPESCRSILEELGVLEGYLHESMLLENRVLYPRALALADAMTADAMNAVLVPV